jgi:hypothetical protein
VTEALDPDSVNCIESAQPNPALALPVPDALTDPEKEIVPYCGTGPHDPILTQVSASASNL